MKLVNLTLADANAFVTEHHRHNKKCQGHKFSIGAVHEGELVGVAIVGRPVEFLKRSRSKDCRCKSCLEGR